jgi:hypothetical protein
MALGPRAGRTALALALLPALLSGGAACAVAGGPGAAYPPTLQPPPPQTSPQEQTLQGLEQMMLGLKRMVEQIPIYGPPEVTADGDIILRRIQPVRPFQPYPPPSDQAR